MNWLHGAIDVGVPGLDAIGRTMRYRAVLKGNTLDLMNLLRRNSPDWNEVKATNIAILRSWQALLNCVISRNLASGIIIDLAKLLYHLLGLLLPRTEYAAVGVWIRAQVELVKC